MAPALNLSNTKVCCVGNHDFDYGIDPLFKLISLTPNTTWLLSNVYNAETKKMLDDCIKEKIIIEWDGIKVGIMGLVESEWIDTLNIDVSQIMYKDFIEVGNRLAKELRDEGAEFIIALTHMRIQNDIILSKESKGIDIILGGHDHFYQIETDNVPVVKSGTDFRNFTEITVTFGGEKPSFEFTKVDITSDIPKDEEMQMKLEEFKLKLEDKSKKVLFYSSEPLDARSSTLRTSESNVGNFLCDVIRTITNADCVLINGGTLRTDDIIPKGNFTVKDLITLLPFIDVIVVLRVSGKTIKKALENGVSMYPKHEGRFPQISGMKFTFDPSREPGNRVTEVMIGEDPLFNEKKYTIATKSYIGLNGKDGYDCFLEDSEVLVDKENGFELLTLVRSYISQMSAVKKWRYRSRNAQLVSKAVSIFTTGSANIMRVSPKIDGRIKIEQQSS